MEKIQSLKVLEKVLVQSNLVDNQYQQKLKVIYTFTPNKSYVNLLNVEPSNEVKPHNAEFDEIIITFADQNDRPLEIEEKVNLTLLIKKQKLHVILQNPEQENMSKDMDFCHLHETYPTNMGNNIGY